MEQQRVFLWVGLLLVLWLNVDAWMKDAAVPQASPAAETAAAPANSGAAPGPAPAGGALADELPSVSGETPAAATPEAAQAEAPAAGAGKIRVVTDVLDLDLNLAGGEFVRADLPGYPRQKEDPTTPVRLFNTDAKDSQFVFQSGLTSGEAEIGRAHV